MKLKNWQPRVGEWVEIRSAQEILATLDAQGDCAGMPFMPEMLQFAGRRFEVSASAHKTCDTVNKTGGRRVRDAVHLADLRCDGGSHGGCQAACLLYWKTQWLKPAGAPPVAQADAAPPSPQAAPPLLASACARTGEHAVTVYRCQATTLPQWSEPLSPYSPVQYWQDVRSGNATLGHALSTLVLAGLKKLRRLPVAYRLNCWIYDTAHRLLRGAGDPSLDARIPRDGATPGDEIHLRVGEAARVKPLEAINATINQKHRNRGMIIDEEMTRYCGQSALVTDRVTRIINEQTGEMMHFKNPCIVLEDMYCRGDYSERRLLCPRRIRSYWREVWLERVDDATG